MNRSNLEIGSALFVLTAGILLASFFYGENYSFLHDPVSCLGRLRTPGGSINTTSHIIFAAGCISAAVFMLSALKTAHSLSLLLMCAGLLLMPVPVDRFPLAHQLASAAAVGGAWLYCSSYLLQPNRAGFLPLLLFQAPVLIYAAMHIAGSSFKEETQTVAIAAVLITMSFSCRRRLSRTKKIRSRGDDSLRPDSFRNI